MPASLGKFQTDVRSTQNMVKYSDDFFYVNRIIKTYTCVSVILINENDT